MSKESNVTKYGKYALLETAAGLQLVGEIGLWAGSWVVRPIGMASIVPSSAVALVTGNTLPLIGSATAVTLGPTLLDQSSKLLGAMRKLTHQKASDIWYSIGADNQSGNLDNAWLEMSGRAISLQPIPPEELEALEQDGWVVMGSDTSFAQKEEHKKQQQNSKVNFI
jgi:hypothetical protein